MFSLYSVYIQSIFSVKVSRSHCTVTLLLGISVTKALIAFLKVQVQIGREKEIKAYNNHRELCKGERKKESNNLLTPLYPPGAL